MALDPVVLIDRIAVADDVDAWTAAGFQVDGRIVTIGPVAIELLGRENGDGMLGWSLDGISDAIDLDGISTAVGDGSAAGRSPLSSHPNGVTDIDHVVLSTPDGPRTQAAIENQLGLYCRRVRDTTDYGSPMQQRFFKLGPVVLEVVSPAEPKGTRTAEFFGLALNVADIDTSAAFLGERLGRVKPAVQEGRRIATMRSGVLGLPVALMSR